MQAIWIRLRTTDVLVAGWKDWKSASYWSLTWWQLLCWT